MIKRIVVVGAGGLAREVAATVRLLKDDYAFVGYAVSDVDNPGKYASRDEIVGDFDWLRKHRGEKFDALVLGIGMPASRLAVAAQLEPDFAPEWWPAVVDPSAKFDRDSCRLGHGVYIGGSVIGTVNLVFEPFSMAVLFCTLGHEAVVRRGAVIMPGVNISGGVDVGEGAMIGTGAQVLQYLKVGARAQVGAGAVVTRDVADGDTVVGVPARSKSKG